MSYARRLRAERRLALSQTRLPPARRRHPVRPHPARPTRPAALIKAR